jgi:hypothetical protein
MSFAAADRIIWNVDASVLPRQKRIFFTGWKFGISPAKAIGAKP